MNAKEGQRAYTVEQAARICKVRASTIRYWLGPYGKAIIAEIEDTGRQGSRKLLSARNLVQIRVAFLLAKAGWPKAMIARELPLALNARKQDWYTPGTTIWGKADSPEWLLFADKKAWGGRPWELMSIAGPRRPDAQHAWTGSALSEYLGDFEVTTIEWPDGWKPLTDLDAFHLEKWVGVQRMTIVNIGHVKRYVAERA